MDMILNASLADVSAFTQDLEQSLQSLPIETRTGIVLAMQELLVNIVQHAYNSQPGQIELQLNQTDAKMAINIRDYANNSFEMPDTITPPDPLELPEHGMGLFIIHQSFDKVTYERLSDGNQWQLVKFFGG